MCQQKDIDTLLEGLQLCHDRKEKLNLLKKLNVCGNCPESSFVPAKENCRCLSEVIEHIEILNLIEHVRQSCAPKRSKDKG